MRNPLITKKSVTPYPAIGKFTNLGNPKSAIPSCETCAISTDKAAIALNPFNPGKYTLTCLIFHKTYHISIFMYCCLSSL